MEHAISVVFLTVPDTSSQVAIRQDQAQVFFHNIATQQSISAARCSGFRSTHLRKLNALFSPQGNADDEAGEFLATIVLKGPFMAA